jgi:hypothetical protein
LVTVIWGDRDVSPINSLRAIPFLNFGVFFRATPTAPDSYMFLLWKRVKGLPVTNGVEAANRPS